ncbi:tyrosine-type recombinase/integrase [Chloroflexota bacterium]
MQLAELAQEYVAERLNTKGLTETSLRTMQGHFRQVIVAFPNAFPDRADIVNFLGQKKPGARRRIFETLRAFGKWLELRKIMDNPWTEIDIAKVPVPLLPAPSPEQVYQLFEYLDSQFEPRTALRNKTIVAVLMESGLRLSELAGIQEPNIDWQGKTIGVWGKGQKEGKAPFGQVSETLLRKWLSEHRPAPGENIWGVGRDGIQVTLKRLKTATGIPCNAHSFRRACACLLRKAGVDTMTIKDLGRWESLEMVQRYTRSVTFEDSLRFYKPPLS